MQAGEIISYMDMCVRESTQLQRGMNYRLPTGRTVVLMSRRPNAPYVDEVIDDGQTIVYEGHDVSKNASIRDPKALDQPERLPSGKLSQNGHFNKAAQESKNGSRAPEIVYVYEKLRDGVWVYNGAFKLADSWQQYSDGRNVFKFRLVITDEGSQFEGHPPDDELEHTRVIPGSVKSEVYLRDGGKCTKCGANDNLHFDHILPFSKGGTSLAASNIQLLCARHNFEKRDKFV